MVCYDETCHVETGISFMNEVNKLGPFSPKRWRFGVAFCNVSNAGCMPHPIQLKCRKI